MLNFVMIVNSLAEASSSLTRVSDFLAQPNIMRTQDTHEERAERTVDTASRTRRSALESESENDDEAIISINGNPLCAVRCVRCALCALCAVCAVRCALCAVCALFALYALCALCALCALYALCALCCDFWILTDLRFAHMHEQFSHSIIRSFESISPVILDINACRRFQLAR